MRVLTAEQMRGVDRRAIEELGIPGMVLMENASVGVADAVGERFPEASTVTIFCGPGNNGGDGLAVARLLDARGYGVHTFLVVGSSLPRGDAGTQLAILERSGRAPTVLRSEDSLDPALDRAERSDLVIDALFGTGLSRPLEGHFADLVLALDRLERPIVAVDLPSGLDGSRGEIPGPHLRAELTVTFAALKVAHVMPPACAAIGEVAVVDLGIPPELVEEAEGDLYLFTDPAARSTLIDADPWAHKGTFGHALVAGGSSGKSGAVVLAARAAVRGGAGLVTAAVPASLLGAVDAGSVESMTLALPETADGACAPEAADVLLAAAAGKAAVGLGPGLGTGEGARILVRRFLEETSLPLVLDADALNVLEGSGERLAERDGPSVLTPHPGEAARLLGTTAAEIQEDRPAAARRLSELTGSVVVLKGYRTLVAEPGGVLWINPTGNAGLGTGGTGDVLTGLVTALLARGYDPSAAARVAVFVHGAAGDRVAAERGRSGLAAGDLVDGISRVWSRWESDHD